MKRDSGESSTTAGEETDDTETASSGDEVQRRSIGCPSPPARQPLGCSARMRARLSPLMAKVLRHSASSWGLELGADGYVPVSELLALPPFVELGATLADVEHVVAWERQASKKQRFALRSGPVGLAIRANQGHSEGAVEGRQLARAMAPAELPRSVVHGTYFRHIDQIVAEGLRPMRRRHVHLFLEEGGVGRRDAELLVYVDVASAAAAGVEFLRAENGVVLSTGGPDGAIPPACLLKVVRVRDGAIVRGPAGAPAPARGRHAHQRVWGDAKPATPHANTTRRGFPPRGKHAGEGARAASGSQGCDTRRARFFSRPE